MFVQNDWVHAAKKETSGKVQSNPHIRNFWQGHVPGLEGFNQLLSRVFSGSPGHWTSNDRCLAASGESGCSRKIMMVLLMARVLHPMCLVFVFAFVRHVPGEATDFKN